MSLKHAVLVILSNKPSSGYDIVQEFRSSIGYFWNASHQQVYQQLKKLTDQSLIEFTEMEQDGKPDKKIYHLTELGQKALQNWSTNEVSLFKTKDELLLLLYGGNNVEPSVLINEVKRHRALREKSLNKMLEMDRQYQALLSEEKRKFRFPYLTLRRGITGEQAWLAWADEVLDELKHL